MRIFSLKENEHPEICSILYRVSWEKVFFPNSVIADCRQEAKEVFSIISGMCRSQIEVESNGRSVLGFFGPGEMFGGSSSKNYTTDLYAQTYATIRVLDITVFRAMCKEFVVLNNSVDSIHKTRIRSLVRHNAILTKMNSLQRLVHFILLDDFSYKGDKNKKYLPMSRIDIADFLGMTPESVTRHMRALKDKGLIIEERHNITIANRPMMEFLSYD